MLIQNHSKRLSPPKLPATPTEIPSWEQVRIERKDGFCSSEGYNAECHATSQQMRGIRTVIRRKNNLHSILLGAGLTAVTAASTGNSAVGAATGLIIGGAFRLVASEFTMETGGGMNFYEAPKFLNNAYNKAFQWGQP